MRAESVAISQADARYGVASGVRIARSENPNPAVALSWSGQFSYFFAEYFKGILFVVLTTFFIFAVPAYITKPAKVHAMLGKALKRTLDLVGAILGLFLTLPFWIVLPLLIKLDSRGPVFYTQLRVGVNRRRKSRRYHQKADVVDRRSRERRREDYQGELFRVIKFRTMVHNAERHTGPVWASKDDSRVTRAGAFLRKTRMDEIPQFLNVLTGDMSLVGPRPERPNFVRELSGKVDNYHNRLNVKPGITGLAQVESGYDSSVATVAEKVRYDLEYIENWSLWTDIKILLKTVKVVLTGKGAC